MTTHRIKALALASLLAVASASVSAVPINTHPDLARGILETGRYDRAGETAINLFNGNLSMAIPIGHSYPVDSRLKYRFDLHYNSQIWDFAAALDGSAEPMASANAGLGFDLGFGRLLAPGTGINSGSSWLLVEPDGRARDFFSDLHWDTPDVGDPADIVQYTRDGSYLRLTHTSSTNKLVEHPDGTFRRFAMAAGEWRVVEIGTADGAHWLQIVYATDDSQWTLTDSHGRVQRVLLSADPANPSRRLVDRLELTAFAGTTAVYTLGYEQIDIARNCADSRPGTVNVSVLTSLTDAVGGRREFSYYDGSTSCQASGRLATAQMRSGGAHGFDYGSYPFANSVCEDQAPTWRASGAGVVSRDRRTANGSTVGTRFFAPTETSGTGCSVDERMTEVTTEVGHRWRYYFGVGSDGPSAGEAADYGLPASDVAELTNAGNGAPGSRLALAKEIYDCRPGAACTLMRSHYERWTQDERCASSSGQCFGTNRRIQQTRVLYHDDEPLNGEQRYRDRQLSNYDGLGHYRHILETSNFGMADRWTEVNYFNPEAGTYPTNRLNGWVVPSLNAPWLLEETSFESTTDEDGRLVRRDYCYDLAGQVTRVRQRGSSPSNNDLITTFAWSGGQRIVKSQYGGDLQTVNVTQDLCQLELPLAPAYQFQSAYQFGTRSSIEWLDDGQSIGFLSLDQDIDAGTGLIARKRDSAGITTDFVYDALGRRSWERPQAGHGPWVQYSYRGPDFNVSGSWGGPRTTRFHRANGQTTGILAKKLEQFDTLGQLFVEQEWLTISPAKARKKVYAHDAAGQMSSYTPWHHVGDPIPRAYYLEIDPFGRPRGELPVEGAIHRKTIDYLGEREVRTTEKSESSYSVSSGQCLVDDVVTTTTYDGQGRVWKHRFERDNPAPGELVERETLYQPDGQWRLVEDTRTVDGSVRINRRTRVYGDQGLLASETLHVGRYSHALRQMAVNTFGDYDARGKYGLLTQVSDTFPAPGMATRHTYDAAGRLIEIADANDPSQKWKEFHFATDNGPANGDGQIDARKGKLHRAVRHNYLSVSTVGHHTVEQAFGYFGAGGSRSEMTVSIDTVQAGSAAFRPDRTFRTSITHDAMARVAELEYPYCVSCLSNEPGNRRTVSRSYDSAGRLTAINGTWEGQPQDWIPQVTWFAGSVPERVDHYNGAADVYTVDASGRDLPASIEVIGSAATLLQTGDMKFDGRDDLCGYGDQSLVAQPDPPPLPPSTSDFVCADSLEVDPFNKWNGQSVRPECRSNVGYQQSYLLYDAQDRLVGVIDLTALMVVLANGEEVWVPDPSEFRQTWQLWDLEGNLARIVSDDTHEAWVETIDKVYGLNRLLAEARVNVDRFDVFHRHPMFDRVTNWQGWSISPQF